MLDFHLFEGHWFLQKAREPVALPIVPFDLVVITASVNVAPIAQSDLGFASMATSTSEAHNEQTDYRVERFSSSNS